MTTTIPLENQLLTLIRLHTRLTIHQLGFRLELPSVIIMEIESGVIARVPDYVVIKYANYFKIPMDGIKFFRCPTYNNSNPIRRWIATKLINILWKCAPE